MGVDWKRPENVPFPSMWRQFEGKKLVNGARRKYWVQDLTEEYRKQAIELMCTVFLEDEALCKYSNLTSYPESIEDFRNLWKLIADQKVALLCLTEGEDGNAEIAGLNMTYVSNKEESETLMEANNEASKKVCGVVHYIYSKVNIIEALGIDEHLSALGLLVLPKFRGEGIGVEILKSRRDLSMAVGLKASITLFSSNTSQAVARKAGFQDIVEVTYEELEKADPNLVFPGIKEVSNSQRYMYIKYQ